MTLHKRAVAYLSACCLVLQCLAPAAFVAAREQTKTATTSSGNLRYSKPNSNKQRQKKPPNRRLRKGIIYKNGAGSRDTTYWQEPRDRSNSNQAEPAETEESITDNYSSAMLAAMATMTETPTATPSATSIVVQEDDQVANSQWEELESYWSSWGTEWNGDGTGPATKGGSERSSSGRVNDSVDAESSDWAQDRNGGLGRDPIDDVHKAEEVYVPVGPTDRKGGGEGRGRNKEKGERKGRGQKAGGSEGRGRKGGGRKGGGSEGRDGDGHKAKAAESKRQGGARKNTKKKGKRKDKRKLEAGGGGHKGNAFGKFSGLGREGTMPTEDNTAVKAAKKAIINIKDLRLFENEEWTHTFFKPLSMDKAMASSGDSEFVQEHIIAEGENEIEEEKKGKGQKEEAKALDYDEAGLQEPQEEIGMIEEHNVIGEISPAESNGAAQHEAQRAGAAPNEDNQEVTPSSVGSIAVSSSSDKENSEESNQREAALAESPSESLPSDAERDEETSLEEVAPSKQEVAAMDESTSSAQLPDVVMDAESSLRAVIHSKQEVSTKEEAHQPPNAEMDEAPIRQEVAQSNKLTANAIEEEQPAHEETFAWEDSNEDLWVSASSDSTTSKGPDSELAATAEAPSLLPTEWADRSDCRICSSGHVATYPTRTIMHTKQTCQELAGELDFASGGSCGQIKSGIPVDIEAYCGCEGAAVTSTCKFCPAGTSNLYKNVTIPSLNYMTCGDVETYAAYIDVDADEEACNEMVHLSELCCGNMDDYWRRSHE